ncbi:hypothetical protein [Paenibacillus aceris]|uniref:Uncharacterized protein n=1 Tax=Paenibacillus aceris TaxID=869555 RepID=A0ABS4I0H7_9BACL|nr:hypothetical protein [Paenibacillus aceris]MBP1964423.1 hypothetical protein [Paenibacillus aceris]NHW35863.1 hypothetical protein [Paenibacillus aceris]
MIKLIFTILLYGAITAYEIPRLKKKNEKIEWIVFLSLMLIGLTLSILFLQHVSVKADPTA